jgi:hypothetical protein
MKVIIKLDDISFAGAKKPLRKVLFPIFWEHEGNYYPSDDWMDFGCVIIGWWVNTLVQLLQGSNEEKFSFMDGPYSLNAKFNQPTGIVNLYPEGTDKTWSIDIIEILKSLSQSIDLICEKFEEEGLNEHDKEVFKKYSAIIQNHLLEPRQE